MIFFHLYPRADYSLSDRFLTTHCFARTDLNSLTEINIRGLGLPDEFGGMSADDFAEKFTNLFDEQYPNHADKDAIKRINILFDEMVMTIDQQKHLLQKIADALFIRGFKNVVVSSLMFPNPHNKPIYIDFNNEMDRYSAYYGDRIKDISIFLKPQKIKEEIRLLENKPTTNEAEKQKLLAQITAARKNLAEAKREVAEHTIVRNQDLKKDLDNVCNHITSYPQLAFPALRASIHSELHGCYLQRKKLLEELQVAKKSFWRMFGAGPIPTKTKQVEELTKRLEMYEFRNLVRDEEQFRL